MFIICPKCSAKYRIPDDILLEKGQKLKCSACNHIFFKGDEAPLELGDFTSASVSETATAQNEEAPFSTPMYRTEIAKISQKVNPLPEAFQPVESKQKQSLWLIPIYIIIILALCTAAWIYHDSLTPSLSGLFPNRTTYTNPTIQKRHPALRVKTNRVKEEKLNPISPVPNVPKTKKTIQFPKPAITIESQTAQPVVKPTVPEKTTMETINPPVDFNPTDMGSAAKSPNEEILPNDDQPLVEEIKTTIPPVQPINLSTLDQNNFKAVSVTFKSEPDKNGQNQLLIEGQIQNITPLNQEGPSFTVKAINREGRILAEKKIKTTVGIIKPQEVVPFYTGIAPAPDSVDHIEIDF